MIEEVWRIDSLDACAGIVFASRRLADPISGHLELDRAAVVLAPPYFPSKALSNRTMGFSVSRGQAQCFERQFVRAHEHA